MSRSTWVRDTLIAAGFSVEDADRAMAEVKAEVRAEDIALIEDRACDADFTEEPLYIVGLRSAADLLKAASPAAVPVPAETAGDEPGEAERLRAELAELTARARRVAVSHEHFIQDHDDPGTEALAAQYELINHLSRSADPGDLPLSPVETALRLVLAVLDETQDDASPREIRRAIADALPRVDMSDRRRRIYVDAKGGGWIDQSVTSDGTRWVVPVTASGPAEKADSVAERTGSLREIGRCW